MLLLSFSASAQRIQVEGILLDAETRESLFGANVFELNSAQGVISRPDGSFSFYVQAQDSLALRISNIGYLTQYVNFRCTKDTLLQLSLQPEARQLEEVIVTASLEESYKYTPYTGVTYMKAEQIRSMVGMLGEPDLIRALQLRPGVQSGGEGTTGMLVRGSTPDQNLVLLEGIPIYNPNHLFGLFSVFDANAIKDVSLYKGAFPAQYGGRIASVLEVDVRKGNAEGLQAQGGVGLMNSRLTLDGPLHNGKVRYLLSGRRTYFNLITQQINESQADNPDFDQIPDYGFYDLLGQVSVDLGSQNELSLTGYQGRDRFLFTSDDLSFQFLWGNRAGAVNWEHSFKAGHSLKNTFAYTNYQYRLLNTYEDVHRTLGSGITDLSWRMNFGLAPSATHRWNIGLELIQHSFDVLRKAEEDVDGNISFREGESDRVQAQEAGAYLSDRWQLSSRLSLESGLRLSAFRSDSRIYTRLEPRFSLRWDGIPDKLNLKLGYSQAAQYVHLVNSSGMSLPANFWYPSNKEIKPQIAEQYAAGVEWQLGSSWQFSQELYYRNMANQLDFKDGAELFGDPEVVSDLTRGRGWAYGSEWLLEKKKGKLTGWVAYTLAWAYRQFPDINKGKVFYATNDRRHDITVVINQKLSRRWAFSTNWVYASGNVTTLPESTIFFQNQRGGNTRFFPHYQERNTVRMPAYHRLDLAFNYKFFPRWGEGTLQLGVYNAYSRRNPYFLFFEQVPAKGSIPKFEARQVSLFPILPTVGLSFRIK